MLRYVIVLFSDNLYSRIEIYVLTLCTVKASMHCNYVQVHFLREKVHYRHNHQLLKEIICIISLTVSTSSQNSAAKCCNKRENNKTLSTGKKEVCILKLVCTTQTLFSSQEICCRVFNISGIPCQPTLQKYICTCYAYSRPIAADHVLHSDIPTRTSAKLKISPRRY